MINDLVSKQKAAQKRAQYLNPHARFFPPSTQSTVCRRSFLMGAGLILASMAIANLSQVNYEFIQPRPSTENVAQ